MNTRMAMGLWLVWVCATSGWTAPVLDGVPVRIISINVSGDRLLLQLVAPERITALSHLASDPELNPLHAEAAGMPRTKGSAEDVLLRHPDLVLAVRWGHGTTLDLLRSRGIAVHELPFPESFAEVRAMIRELALVLGTEERGEELIAEMDALLADDVGVAGGVSTGSRGRAVVFGHGGYSNGRGSILGDVLRHAGWAPYPRPERGRITLESLVLSPPDLVVRTPYRSNHPTLAYARLEQAERRGLVDPERTVVVPTRYTICADNLSAGAVALLRREAR